MSVIPTVSPKTLAKAKPVTLDPKGGAYANNSILGIVEGISEENGARIWIVRAARGDLRARLTLPNELDDALAALAGRFARIWVDKAGVYHVERESYVDSRAPRLIADRDDPSRRYRP